MNAKKILALMLCAMMLLSLAACGAKGNDKQADMSGDSSAMTGEPKTAEEALALHKELLERENALLSENAELWEKVFMAADKGMTMQEDGKNYGDFLLDTIEGAKDQFTDEEYEMLKESATKISNIENKLTELENKSPDAPSPKRSGWGYCSRACGASPHGWNTLSFSWLSRQPGFGNEKDHADRNVSHVILFDVVSNCNEFFFF